MVTLVKGRVVFRVSVTLNSVGEKLEWDRKLKIMESMERALNEKGLSRVIILNYAHGSKAEMLEAALEKAMEDLRYRSYFQIETKQDNLYTYK